MAKWKAILPRNRLSGHPLSLQSLSWARSRLAECQISHDACRRLMRGGQLPTRLRCLRKLPDKSMAVRLVGTSSNRGSRCIVALLGPTQIMHHYSELALATKERHPMDVDPTTFRDAIIYAWQLDIDYIWIDSLCILQDSQEDWEVEWAKMVDIYERAVMVLAASSSPGDSHGCFPSGDARY